MKHDLPFDPTYSHDLDALKRVGYPPEPAGFSDFWEDLYRRTLRVPTRSKKRLVTSDHPELDVFEIEFDSLDGFRVGAWLTLPKEGTLQRGLVVGHGYGGRGGPDLQTWATPTASIFPCGRGFNRSAAPGIPAESSGHVLHGIASRETYIHGRCAADMWAAASVLLELFPQIAGQLDYSGGSFGGGIGALAVAWEPRFHRAFLDVPSFGNHPLRLTLRCNGSGEFVRHYHRHHPEVIDVLSYFDAATAARHIHIPVMVAAAKFDPAVPPPGQFAVFNSLAGPKRLFVRETGHFDHPGLEAEDARLSQEIGEWFS